MVSASYLNQIRPARVMLVGWPKSGKTGCLACLLDAGFKLRLIDFDGNYDPLLHFAKKENLGNLDVLTFEDKLRRGPKYTEVSGMPTAFSEAWAALDHWRTINPETGEMIDLGQSKDWGPDTIVVLDSLTGMGRASIRRAIAMMNRTPLNFRHSDYGLAMNEQEALLEHLTNNTRRHHVIGIAHLRMIGPKETKETDTDLTKELRQREAELIPTRLCPSALGRALPPTIAEHFPALVLAQTIVGKGNRIRRVIRTAPLPEMDLGVPAADLPVELDISDGMLKIFDAITGGIEKCLSLKAS